VRGSSCELNGEREGLHSIARSSIDPMKIPWAHGGRPSKRATRSCALASRGASPDVTQTAQTGSVEPSAAVKTGAVGARQAARANERLRRSFASARDATEGVRGIHVWFGSLSPKRRGSAANVGVSWVVPRRWPHPTPSSCSRRLDVEAVAAKNRGTRGRERQRELHDPSWDPVFGR
jgi:hypothetical protein